MKNKLRCLWITTIVSFVLSIQYIERYADAKNRMIFFWQSWDGLAIVFACFLLGLPLCVAWLWAKKTNNPRLIIAAELIFMFILWFAIIKDVDWWLSKLISGCQGAGFPLKLFVYFLYAALFFILVMYLFGRARKAKNASVNLCLILSLVIPVFILISFTYRTWNGNKGSMLPAPLPAAKAQGPNIYIFIFDEWSYDRTYHGRKPCEMFVNLGRFRMSALTFHNAYSPYDATFRSVPSIIFQDKREFILDRGRLFFEQAGGRDKADVRGLKSIFSKPKEQGYFTAVIGEYHPYASFVGDDVDFVRAFSSYKIKGDGFFAVTYYHILKNIGLYLQPFSHMAVSWLEAVTENQYQIKRTGGIHRLALSIIGIKGRPVFALFHYSLPHEPFMFSSRGSRGVYRIYERTPENYAENLAYLDVVIGEVIAALKHSGNYDNSFVVMTSDHSWRSDPEQKEGGEKRRHVPLLVKMPGQKEPLECDNRMDSWDLFDYLRRNYPQSGI